MSELEFLRLHEDGQRLVLAAPDGTRHTLALTPHIRSVLRREQPAGNGEPGSESPAHISPREIQTRLRAGESPETLAADSGMTMDVVNRYAGPVIAEQEYVIGRVQASRQTYDAEAPTLGELVAQRLTTRDVDPESVQWSAARHHGEPWVVSAEFEVGAKSRVARWKYDTSTRVLHAVDDEARWLSQPDISAGSVFEPEGVHLAAMETAAVTDSGDTDTLLDDLYLRRGVRTRKPAENRSEIIAGGEDSPFDSFGPASSMDLDELDELEAMRGRTAPDPAPEVHDAKIVELPRPAQSPQPNKRPAEAAEDADGETPPRDPRPRKGRAKVPSLNDIVFGAKPKS